MARRLSLAVFTASALFVAVGAAADPPTNRIMRIIITENPDYTNGSAMPACFATTVPKRKAASYKNLDTLEWKIETDNVNKCPYYAPASFTLEFPNPSPVNNVKYGGGKIKANVDPGATQGTYKYKVMMKDPTDSTKSYMAEDPELDIRGDMPPPLKPVRKPAKKPAVVKKPAATKR